MSRNRPKMTQAQLTQAIGDIRFGMTNMGNAISNDMNQLAMIIEGILIHLGLTKDINCTHCGWSTIGVDLETVENPDTCPQCGKDLLGQTTLPLEEE